MTEVVTAKLTCPLSKADLEDAWKSERAKVNLPDINFEAAGNQISISVDPRHRGSVPVAEIKRSFEIAMHRRHGPGLQIEWLDGPPPPLRPMRP